jgi:hypothetical protein
LVEVSPSTVIRLNEPPTASIKQDCNKSLSSPASVTTNASMVAISGRIIPAPLATPVTVTVCPSTSSCREAPLGTVSVVMIPYAASTQPSSDKRAQAPGKPALILSTGSDSPITPVENGNTASGEHPALAASRVQHSRASRRPCSPVPALALPVFTSRYSGDVAARCSRATVTGAAQKALRVNTAAQVDPSSSAMTTRSFRSGDFIPAQAVPSRNPATGKSSCCFFVSLFISTRRIHGKGS